MGDDYTQFYACVYGVLELVMFVDGLAGNEQSHGLRGSGFDQWVKEERGMLACEVLRWVKVVEGGLKPLLLLPLLGDGGKLRKRGEEKRRRKEEELQWIGFAFC
ncbi:hypothetical protein Ancab_004675 [Ancistrocladus abbreviatus]